jgi:hypothetical protein
MGISERADKDSKAVIAYAYQLQPNSKPVAR